MYTNKNKKKKSTKANVFEHNIVPSSKKEQIPKPKEIFVMNNNTEKNKKKVKK